MCSGEMMLALVLLTIAQLNLTFTERTLSEENMLEIGTQLKTNTCVRFSFENSVMTVCRMRRRVSMDLSFKDWFDFSEVNR